MIKLLIRSVDDRALDIIQPLELEHTNSIHGINPSLPRTLNPKTNGMARMGYTCSS
jgi:hypothetical protein